MIGYEGLTLSDLYFYWQNEEASLYVYHQCDDFVWRPARILSSQHEYGSASTALADAYEEHGGLYMQVVYTQRRGRPAKTAAVEVDPAELFTSRRWKMYRPPGGWVATDSGPAFLQERVVRSRLKGISAGSSWNVLTPRGRSATHLGALLALGERMSAEGPLGPDMDTHPAEWSSCGVFSPFYAYTCSDESLRVYGPPNPGDGHILPLFCISLRKEEGLPEEAQIDATHHHIYAACRRAALLDCEKEGS